MQLNQKAKFWHPDKSVILNCEIGDNTVVHAFVWIGNNVKIGKNCRIQAFAFIPDGVTIGNDVFIGPHVCFTNDKRPPSVTWLDTVVEDRASIGASSVILPGIRIGKGSLIGAGSVVTKSVPAMETWFGNPALPSYLAKVTVPKGCPFDGDYYERQL